MAISNKKYEKKQEEYKKREQEILKKYEEAKKNKEEFYKPELRTIEEIIREKNMEE